MILHVASLLTSLANAVVQAPVVVPCTQVAQQPEWKWWFGVLAPWVGPLLSCVVSIYVAWKVFNWQGRKDREQWVRDQKKAEWSSLLRSVANVYQTTQFLNGWNRKIADRIVSELEPALNEVSIAQANCVFLDKFRLNNKGGKKIREFLLFATTQLPKLRGNLGLFDSINDRSRKAGSVTDRDSSSVSRCIDIVSHELSDLAERSCNILVWLQNEAALDLDITAESEEHRVAMRWTKLFNFTRKKIGS